MDNPLILPNMSNRLGEHIRRLRQERKLSVRELAALARISHGTVSNVERGDTEPDTYTLRQLSRALGEPTDTLFDLLEADRQIGSNEEAAPKKEPPVNTGGTGDGNGAGEIRVGLMLARHELSDAEYEQLVAYLKRQMEEAKALIRSGRLGPTQFRRDEGERRQ